MSDKIQCMNLVEIMHIGDKQVDCLCSIFRSEVFVITLHSVCAAILS